MVTPNVSQSDKDLANKLLSLHITESPYSRVPAYEYEKLKKGLDCKICHSFSLKNTGKSMICLACDSEETLEDGIMRAVKEYHDLYPERAITVGAIYEWCGQEINKKIIASVLKKNLIFVYKGGHSHYLYVEKI